MSLRAVLDSGRLVLTLGVLAGGTWYAYAHSTELVILTQVGLLDFSLLVLGIASVFVATGFTFFLLVRTTGVKMEITEWVGLTFVSSALNYLIPVRPGIVAKATYLKRKTTLSYSRFSSVLVANAVLFVGTSALLGLAALVWLRPAHQAALLLTGMCALLVVLSLIPLYMPLFRFHSDRRLFQILDSAVLGFEEIRAQRGRMVWIGLSIVLQLSLSSIVFMFAFTTLGFEINFPIALWLVSLVSLGNVLAITPNNIGIQELVIAYGYLIVGLDFQDGLLVGALVRGGHMLLTIVIAPWFTYSLLHAKNLKLTHMISDTRRLP